MKRPLALTILLILVSPAAIQATNLRAGSLVNNEESFGGNHAERERRRLESIINFWTPERIHNAIPRDIRIPKNRRNLVEVTDDLNTPVPRNLSNPNQYLIEFGGRFLECKLTHEPFTEDGERQLAASPEDRNISPTKNAILTTQYIDFVVDVSDDDGDLKSILFVLKDFTTGGTKRTSFSANFGNGRYTFNIGPFTDGSYAWAVRAVDETDKKSRREFSEFTVQLGGSTGPPPGGDIEYTYHSPLAQSGDPVTFEFTVTGDGIIMLYLMLTFPDGSTGYLSREPTSSGRDSVSVELEESGIYKWSIWAEKNSKNFDEGPISNFKLNGKPPSPDCEKSLGHYTERNQDLHKAVGRILFRFDSKTYLCSGTLVVGAKDRALIATAAHCVFDSATDTFPDYVMFIPGQDDGEGDGSDYNCKNDPNGCFYPTFGVIPEEYRKANFEDAFQYDYGFYVAPDTDMGTNNGPDRETFGGENYKSLAPMGINFNGMKMNEVTHLFGYPGSRDPNFMYTSGLAEESPITDGGWYVDCSGLTGGASGGPWTQSDPATGKLVLASVNSWGWSDGRTGMGSPPYNTGGAKCVYDAANAASLDSSDIVATCPK